LVLKPHPLEVDLTYFDNLAGTIGCTNYKIVNDEDLYQLLAISDYVVTSFSTVGTEAVYFKKPLIIYDPLNQDVMKYVEDGVGIQAKNSSELIAILERLANRSIVIDKAVQEHFILNNAFKIDGDVCDRIINKL
jgi:CDP-glycerol glycerophosphotransferase (TagB/SpsB family)